MGSIAVVEDDGAYRAYLEALLRGSGEWAGRIDGFDSAEALLAEAKRAVRGGRRAVWDTVLIGLEVGGRGGLARVRALRAALPGACIVVLSRRDDPDTILAAVHAGADGYLLKQAPADRLLAELRGACSGGAPLGAEIARSIVHAVRQGGLARQSGGVGGGAGRFGLTPRELDVLRCLASGHSYRATAQHLGIGVDTVRTYVRSVYAKLGAHSAAEAVWRAVRAGLI